MDILNNLTDEQRDLIIRLPFRAGIWVSEADETGGAESQMREEQVLHNLLEGFAADVFGSELIQHIMAGTIAGKEDWHQWEKDIAAFPEECRRGLDVLREVSDEKEVKAFVIRLMEIGEAVALAFRERSDHAGFGARVSLFISYMQYRMARMKASGGVTGFEAFTRVSRLERKALEAMADALGTKYA